MNRKDILIVAWLVSFGFLSLWVKANGQVLNAEPDRAADQGRIARFMEDNGLAPFKQVVLTLQGDFSARVFVGEGCAGGLLALPLHRNAEGEHLAGAFAQGSAVRTIFIYGGRPYGSFPGIPFWFGESLRSIGSIFKSKQRSAGMVLSVTTGKDCPLVDALGWRSL